MTPGQGPTTGPRSRSVEPPHRSMRRSTPQGIGQGEGDMVITSAAPLSPVCVPNGLEEQGPRSSPPTGVRREPNSAAVGIPIERRVRRLPAKPTDVSHHIDTYGWMHGAPVRRSLQGDRAGHARAIRVARSACLGLQLHDPVAHLREPLEHQRIVPRQHHVLRRGRSRSSRKPRTCAAGRAGC